MWWLSLTTTVQPLKYILWFMCLLYMFYALPSAIMYFNNEMVRKEMVTSNNQFEIDSIKDRLRQIKMELDSISTYKNTEGKTGYGSRSKDIKSDKDSLVSEQNEKLDRLSKLTKENTSNGANNPFNGVGWFMGLIVGITVFIFYFGEFLIIWHMVEDKKPKKTLQTELSVSDVTVPVTDVTDSKKCLICGENFIPSRRDQIYCGDNCKVKAYRNRLIPKEII
jgi:hypothetical protein